MAKVTIRKVFKIFFITLNTVVSCLFLLGCLSPWLNPSKFWAIGFIGLMMPYLIMLMLLSIIFWLIVKPKLVLIPVIVFFIGYKQMSVVFGWHFKTAFVEEKVNTNIRIVDWNIQGFNGLSKNKNARRHIREDIANSIDKLNPDVVCLQEFNNSSNKSDADNISLFNKKYPYYFFSKDYYTNNKTYQSGCVIFSKTPIINSGKINYPSAESLIFADVVKGNDTIRVFTTHLQSFKFKKQDYDDIEKIKTQDEDALAASKNIFYKMKLAFKRRGKQAAIVRTEIDKSPYPSFICGDFNDVPNSFTYFHIKGKRQDAFLKKNFGIGRSFISIAPTLRIDYILPDNNFDIQQFDMIDEGFSDHIMLVCDLQLKTKK
jgi:endonuclease/exonuclease/phosphatase family metal-dependent hydrolase